MVLRLSTFPVDVRAAGPFYAQSSVPSAPGTGSIWWNTNDGKTYIYTGSAWAESSTANVASAQTSQVNSWTAAQRGAVVTLTDAASIASDFSLANNFAVTLGGNRTLANPTNLAAGQAGQIVVSQDGTGSRTLAYGSYWKFPAGTAPTLSTAASTVDILSYYVWNTTHIAVSAALAFA